MNEPGLSNDNGASLPNATAFAAMPGYAADEKPPLGVYPRWLAEEKRYSDLLDAIVRYRIGQYIIPPEWLEEAGEIARRMHERKRHTSELSPPKSQ